jgi:hypothetical protein
MMTAAGTTIAPAAKRCMRALGWLAFGTVFRDWTLFFERHSRPEDWRLRHAAAYGIGAWVPVGRDGGHFDEILSLCTRLEALVRDPILEVGVVAARALALVVAELSFISISMGHVRSARSASGAAAAARRPNLPVRGHAPGDSILPPPPQRACTGRDAAHLAAPGQRALTIANNHVIVGPVRQ